MQLASEVGPRRAINKICRATFNLFARVQGFASASAAAAPFGLRLPPLPLDLFIFSITLLLLRRRGPPFITQGNKNSELLLNEISVFLRRPGSPRTACANSKKKKKS